jgi:peptidoglycan/xylan/chitin deacetylase (PgdA/CDA1 family)
MKKGLKRLYRSFTNLIDTPAVVLLYHRVTKLPMDPQQLSVDPENFSAQVKLLKQKYNLLEVDAFAEMIEKKKKIPKNAVLITFDDGYADNFYEALPILENNNAQALFYITTSNLDTKNEFWWDVLERVFLLGSDLPEQLSINHNWRILTFATRNKIERTKAYELLHPIVKECKTTTRDSLMEYILKWANLSREGRNSHRIMTSEEVKKFARSKSVIIGAHTETHPKLSIYSHQEQYQEISLSKYKLEKLINKPIEHFSYPFGTKEDYNEDAIRVVRDLGFKMVCANYHGQVHRWHSKFEIPRILVRDWNKAEFENKMTSFFRY